MRERIGEGGMGVVWSAEDNISSEPVALKFVAKTITRQKLRALGIRRGDNHDKEEP